MNVIDWFQYPDGGGHMPLSNFYPSLFTLDGFEWQTVEHYYQASKSATPEGYHAIRQASTAGHSKRMGREVALRRDWEQVKLHVMRDALAAKFAPGRELSTWLIATQDALLVEGNTWHDTFWGRCICNRHAGQGDNWLGFMLMARRAELRSGAL